MDKIRKGKRMMGNEENKTLYDIYRGILCNNQSFQLGKQAQVEYRFDCAAGIQSGAAGAWDQLSEQIQDTGGMLSGTGDLRPESENAALFAL